jgi:nucleotide-binding universal stress UspA family protein
MYNKILVALDGSKYSLSGGDIALEFSKQYGSEIIAAHIYDGKIHSVRLREMEPDLPEKYQEEETLKHVRDSHNELIYEGFKSLSKGYIEEFEKMAADKKINVHSIHREGRNYSGILQLARENDVDLIVMGAYGLGFTSNEALGSATSKVLRESPCDILIARKEFSKGDILIGVDGSPESEEALRKSVTMSKTFGKQLNIASAYDPFLHGTIFNVMAEALSKERQEDIGLNKQQALHDNIVDEGLGKLYKRFLDKAEIFAVESGIKPKVHLLKGKTFTTIVDLSEKQETDVIIAGRFGHHRDEQVKIGSNSEAIVRHAGTNVLITV